MGDIWAGDVGCDRADDAMRRFLRNPVFSGFFRHLREIVSSAEVGFSPLDAIRVNLPHQPKGTKAMRVIKGPATVGDRKVPKGAFAVVRDNPTLVYRHAFPTREAAEAAMARALPFPERQAPPLTGEPQKSMTLDEARDLLCNLTGKEVRGRLVDLVWLTIERSTGSGRAFQLCIVPAPFAPRTGATTLERLLTLIGRTCCLECGCADEDELRRVIADPSQGEWCLSDETPSWYTTPKAG